MPVRKWTEEEERRLQAMYGSMPVAELLAHFPGKSLGGIKWKVEEFGLSTRRDWDSGELSDLEVLASHNVPTRVIARLLGREEQAVNVKISKARILRGKATRAQGIDAERALGTLQSGSISEATVAIRLVEEGFDVFRPFKPNHITDLLAISGTAAARVQVKAANLDALNKRYRLPVTAKRRFNRVMYTSDDTDAVVVVCRGAGAMYVIPTGELPTSGYLHFYPTRSAAGTSAMEVWRDAFGVLRTLPVGGSLTPLAANAVTHVVDGDDGAAPVAAVGGTVGRRNFTAWEDDVIRLLLPAGIPVREAARLMRRNGAVVRLRADVLGVHIQSPADGLGVDESSGTLPGLSDTHLYGALTESLVVDAMALRGIDMYLPWVMNAKADAVALVRGRPVKLQIKGTSAVEQEGRGGWRVSLSRRNRVSGQRLRYSADEVDYLLVNCALRPDVYVIPWDRVANCDSILLYPDRHSAKQKSEDWEMYLNRFDLLDSGPLRF